MFSINKRFARKGCSKLLIILFIFRGITLLYGYSPLEILSSSNPVKGEQPSENSIYITQPYDHASADGEYI